MIIIFIAIAAFVGGIVNALLGWTQTTECFNPRKFVSSAIVALIGAVTVAVSFVYIGDEFTNTASMITSLLVAFLSGAGVTAGVSRVSGSISK